MTNRIPNRLPNFNCPRRPQNLKKPSVDKRTKEIQRAKFNQQFLRGISSRAELSRWKPWHQTNNISPALSHLITFLALSSVAGSVAASLSDASDSGQNTGGQSHLSSTFRSTPQHFATSRPLPIVGSAPHTAVPPRRLSKQNKSAAFIAHPTLTPAKTVSRTDKKKPVSPRPQHQPIHQRRSHIRKHLIEKQAGPHTRQHPDLTHQPHNETRVKRDAKDKKTSTIYIADSLTKWEKNELRKKLAKAQRTEAKKKALSNAIRFNPLTQTIQDFCEQYMEAIFAQRGLPKSAIRKPLRVEIPLTQPLHAPSTHLRPKQLQPIVLEINTTPFDIATGTLVKRVEEQAGEYIALTHQFKIHWTSEFDTDARRLMSGNGMTDAYRDFMARSLKSGPLAGKAIKNINTLVTGTLMASYQKLPLMENNIDHLKQHIRSVEYRGDPVIDVYVGAPIVKDTFGTLYHLKGKFPPTPIDSTATSLLQNPLYQNAIKEGLPLKTSAIPSSVLFKPSIKNAHIPRLVPAQLTFSDPGNPGDVLWPHYPKKFASDYDFFTLSIEEQNHRLTLGLTQSGIKATVMMMEPVLPQWMLAAIGVAGSLPDALMAMIVDDPQKAHESISAFATSLIIEAIGGVTYARYKSVIKQEVHKLTSEIITNPAVEREKLSELMEWSKTLSTDPESTIGPVADTYLVTSESGVSTTHTWAELTPEQQAHVTMATILTGVNLPYQECVALLKSWDEGIIATFNGSQTPQEQFNKLSVPAHKYMATTLALINQEGTLNRTEALTLAEKKYAEPINPANLDKFYLSVLTPSIKARANDTDACHNVLEHPADTLRSALSLSTPERVKEFLTSPKGRQLFNTTTEMRNNPSWEMQKKMLAFSSKQTDIFFKNFDETVLPEPGYFYREAMVDAHIRTPVSEEAKPITEIAANYKRTLAVDLAAPHLARQVLNKLNYYNNGSIALSGYAGQHLNNLRNLDVLNSILGYSWLNDQERLAVFRVIHDITGISREHPMGSLNASIERVLSVLPDNTKLSEANYPEDENEFLTQLVALDLAKSNDVGPVDPKWAKDFWEMMRQKRQTIPNLGYWMIQLVRKYNERVIDRTVEAIRSLHAMAKADPDGTITREMIDFAIQITQSTLPKAVIDGNSAGSRAEASRNYLEDVMGEQPMPRSREEWKNLLPTDSGNAQNPSDTKLHTAKNQPAGDAMIMRAMEIIKWPGGPTMSPIQQDEQLSGPDFQEDSLAAARQLVQGGFKGIAMTISGVPTQLEQVANEHKVTTVFRYGGAWFDSDYLPVRDDGLNRMLAEIKGTDLFCSEMPDNDQTQLMVNNRILNNDPVIKKLPAILDLMTDYADHGGAGIFNRTFDIDQAVIDGSKLDHRAFFTDCYDSSSCFRLLVNAAESVLDSWKILPRSTPGIDPLRKTLFMPGDNNLSRLIKDIDLTGAEQDISVERIFLKQLMGVLLKEENEPGINSLMVDVILQQIGREELAYVPMDPRLSPREQMLAFQDWLWVTKAFDAKIKDVFPIQFMGGSFTNKPNEGVTLKQLERLPILEAPLPFFSLSNAISVAGPDNSDRYLENIDSILKDHYLRKGIFSQLIATCQKQISTENPWHFVYLEDPYELEEKLSTFEASHWLDYDNRKAYLANTAKKLVLTLGPNGLMPLDPETQLMIVMMEIFTGKPELTEEQARNNQGLAVLLANLAFKEVDEDATPVLAAAMIDGAAPTEVSLKLLKNCNWASRLKWDEDQIVLLQSVHNDA